MVLVGTNYIEFNFFGGGGGGMCIIKYCFYTNTLPSRRLVY